MTQPLTSLDRTRAPAAPPPPAPETAVTATQSERIESAVQQLFQKMSSTLFGAASEPSAGPSYLIKKDDTLGQIAARFGVTVAEIMKLNPHILDPDRIFSGNAIRLPASARAIGQGDSWHAQGPLDGEPGATRAHHRWSPVRTAQAAALPDNGLAGTGSGGITEADFARAAKSLGVSVATIKAVSQVESSGQGMLPSGKPKVLFEAHVFARQTHHRYNASNPGISSATWNRSLYGKAGEHQWDRLEEARRLDPEAALKSASYGRFQIMGFNHKAAGYPDVKSFTDAMAKGEGEQLKAFANFIKAHPTMHLALKKQDWAAFARAYNGPKYAENGYDAKLSRAHDRYDS